MEECKCSREGDLATLVAQNVTLFKEVESLKKVNSTILELSNNITKLVEQMRETKDDVKDIKGDLEEIKRQPRDEYNHYKKLIVGGIIALVIGYVFGKLL